MRIPAAAALLAVAGAVLMPVSLFLDWYEVSTGDSTFKVDGWGVFESTDALLVLASITTVALVATRPANVGRALMMMGAFATGFIAVQMIDRPGVLGFVEGPGVSLEFGAYRRA